MPQYNLDIAYFSDKSKAGTMAHCSYTATLTFDPPALACVLQYQHYTRVSRDDEANEVQLLRVP
jgi:hypothetical protein